MLNGSTVEWLYNEEMGNTQRGADSPNKGKFANSSMLNSSNVHVIAELPNVLFDEWEMRELSAE